MHFVQLSVEEMHNEQLFVQGVAIPEMFTNPSGMKFKQVLFNGKYI